MNAPLPLSIITGLPALPPQNFHHPLPVLMNPHRNIPSGGFPPSGPSPPTATPPEMIISHPVVHGVYGYDHTVQYSNGLQPNPNYPCPPHGYHRHYDHHGPYGYQAPYPSHPLHTSYASHGSLVSLTTSTLLKQSNSPDLPHPNNISTSSEGIGVSFQSTLGLPTALGVPQGGFLPATKSNLFPPLANGELLNNKSNPLSIPNSNSNNHNNNNNDNSTTLPSDSSEFPLVPKTNPEQTPSRRCSEASDVLQPQQKLQTGAESSIRVKVGTDIQNHHQSPQSFSSNQDVPVSLNNRSMTSSIPTFPDVSKRLVTLIGNQTGNNPHHTRSMTNNTDIDPNLALRQLNSNSIKPPMAIFHIPNSNSNSVPPGQPHIDQDHHQQQQQQQQQPNSTSPPPIFSNNSTSTPIVIKHDSKDSTNILTLDPLAPPNLITSSPFNNNTIVPNPNLIKPPFPKSTFVPTPQQPLNPPNTIFPISSSSSSMSWSCIPLVPNNSSFFHPRPILDDSLNQSSTTNGSVGLNPNNPVLTDLFPYVPQPSLYITPIIQNCHTNNHTNNNSNTNINEIPPISDPLTAKPTITASNLGMPMFYHQIPPNISKVNSEHFFREDPHPNQHHDPASNQLHELTKPFRTAGTRGQSRINSSLSDLYPDLQDSKPPPYHTRSSLRLRNTQKSIKNTAQPQYTPQTQLPKKKNKMTKTKFGGMYASSTLSNRDMVSMMRVSSLPINDLNNPDPLTTSTTLQHLGVEQPQPQQQQQQKQKQSQIEFLSLSDISPTPVGALNGKTKPSAKSTQTPPRNSFLQRELTILISKLTPLQQYTLLSRRLEIERRFYLTKLETSFIRRAPGDGDGDGDGGGDDDNDDDDDDNRSNPPAVADVSADNESGSDEPVLTTKQKKKANALPRPVNTAREFSSPELTILYTNALNGVDHKAAHRNIRVDIAKKLLNISGRYMTEAKIRRWFLHLNSKINAYIENGRGGKFRSTTDEAIDIYRIIDHLARTRLVQTGYAVLTSDEVSFEFINQVLGTDFKPTWTAATVPTAEESIILAAPPVIHHIQLSEALQFHRSLPSTRESTATSPPAIIPTGGNENAQINTNSTRLIFGQTVPTSDFARAEKNPRNDKNSQFIFSKDPLLPPGGRNVGQ
jgi:hypothetical protein